jgi:F-type H+-transporting ATPase subunit epsilon
MMRLQVLLPTKVLIDEEVGKVIAEAYNGSFGMLPRHIDFVAALAPGILLYETEAGGERYVGIDEGILVKCGDEVMVSTRSAVPGDDLRTLQRSVQEQYVELDERETMARSALARLEAGVVRRFIELQERT